MTVIFIDSEVESGRTLRINSHVFQDPCSTGSRCRYLLGEFDGLSTRKFGGQYCVTRTSTAASTANLVAVKKMPPLSTVSCAYVGHSFDSFVVHKRSLS